MTTITTQTATVEELRWFLFSMSLCTVINGDEERSYKESREYLTSLDNQNRVYNYAIKDGYLYIWG